MSRGPGPHKEGLKT